MSKRIPRIALLSWVLLLATVPTAAYVVHVFSNISEVQDSNLRTLAKAADITRQILENSVDTVTNLAASKGYACEFLRRQTRLALPAGKSCSDVKPSPGSTAMLEAGTSSIQIKFGDQVFDVQLDRILDEIPFGDDLDFLLIVNETGQVIRQHRPPGAQDVGLLVNSLEELSTYDGAEGLSPRALQRSSYIGKVHFSGTDYELLCQPLPLEVSAAQSQIWGLCGLVSSENAMRQALEVAPLLAILLFSVVMFAVLTWPILKLFGISRRERFRFGDIYFLLFGTWGSVMVATILLLGADTFNRLRHASDQSLEDLSEQIDTRIRHELAELHSLLQDYDNSFKALYGELPEAASSALSAKNGQMLRARGLYTRRVRFAIEDAESGQTRMAELAKPDALFNKRFIDSDFEMVFWIRPCDGRQFAKATIRDSNTGQVSLATRDYYNAIQEQRLWPAGYFVETIRSVTTGEFRTVLSTRSGAQWRGGNNWPEIVREQGCSPGSGVVAAIQTRLITTTSPVLDPGVGFAIVDEGGNAVLHSDERRALVENLFEEMGDGDRLSAIVQSGTTAGMDTTYLGRPHQVFVRPIEQTPWTIVAFADKATLDTTILEILLDSLIFTIAYVSFCVFLTLIYLVRHGQEIFHFYWPDPKRNRAPLRSAGLLLVTAIGLTFLVVRFNDYTLMTGALAVPVLTMLAIYASSRRPRVTGNIQIATGLSYLRWSMVLSLLLWLIIAVLPAYAFFKFSLSHQMPILLKHENLFVANQFTQRNCSIEGFYRGVTFGCRNTTISPQDCPVIGRYAYLQDRRYTDSSDFYRSTMFVSEESQETLTSKAAAVSNRTPWAWLARHKPIYNATVGQFRYLDFSPYWRWASDGGLLLDTLQFSGPSSCGTELRLHSTQPVDSPVLGSFSLLGGFGLLILGFAWVRYGTRKLFFGDVEVPRPIEVADIEHLMRSRDEESNKHLIAIVASPRDRERLLSERQPPDDYRRIALDDHFRVTSDRRDILATLENALAGRESVLIVSSIDPSVLIASLASTSSAGKNSDEVSGESVSALDEARRWRLALSHFSLLVVAWQAVPPPLCAHGYWRRGLDRRVTREWLDAELASIPELRDVLGPYDFTGLSRRGALDRIGELADGLYRALWDACSEEEKLVLVQLTLENVINPKQAEVVRRLLQRGFLRRDPTLRLVNQSFALYVSRIQDPGEVFNWEHGVPGRRWEYMRWGLLGVLLLILLFLWTTQRDIFNTGIALLSGIAIGIPGLVKVLTSVNQLGRRDDA